VQVVTLDACEVHPFYNKKQPHLLCILLTEVIHYFPQSNFLVFLTAEMGRRIRRRIGREALVAAAIQRSS